MTIVRCLPGSGKSYLAGRDDRFVDSDKLIEMCGYKEAEFDKLLDDRDATARYFRLCREIAQTKCLLGSTRHG